MIIRVLTFTERGHDLACRLRSRLIETMSGESDDLFCDVDRACETDGLAAWTTHHFSVADALVFVGAAAIAVRAIAPLLQSKATDPAVVVIDEGERFVIPLLSGHLGGANALAQRMADAIGAMPIITTATDGRGLFAVDSWARAQGLSVLEVDRIKRVSSKLLDDERVSLYSRWPLPMPAPRLVDVVDGQGDISVDVSVDVLFHDEPALHLVPRAITLGIGCRRGVTAAVLEESFFRFCGETGLIRESIVEAATIDIKRDERGLLDFCSQQGWPLRFARAEELSAVEGSRSSSAFVRSITGVDNVCERAALVGVGSTLLLGKWSSCGVTFAAALRDLSLTWDW